MQISECLADRSHYDNIIIAGIHARWIGIVAVIYTKIKGKVVDNLPRDIEFENSPMTAIRVCIGEDIQRGLDTWRISVAFVMPEGEARQ